jgi:hypothetical protein
MILLLLEDDDRRTEAMVRVLAALPDVELVRHDSAPDTIAWLRDHPDAAALIVLDHDLGPSRLRDGERFEPGIGRDVSDYLLELTPSCPVLIHSTNGPAAFGMQFSLESAGWSVTRVYPFDDLEWIARDWFPEVVRLLSAP